MLAKSLQLCPTLYDPVDCSLLGFSVCGILQTRRLEWVAISSSRESSRLRDQTHISCGVCIADRFFTAELMVVLSLCCFVGFPLVVARGELLSRCGAWASHCGGFSFCRAWTVGCTGFSSCCTWTPEHRLNSCGLWKTRKHWKNGMEGSRARE